MRIVFPVWAVVMTLFTNPAVAEEPAGGLKVISARFGLVDYHQPGLRSGDFGIRPMAKIPRKEKYFGWVIEVQCLPGQDQVDWVETTLLPGKLPGARPGKSTEDPTITMAGDLRSFVTRRAAVCRNGMARLEDLYAREEGMPVGEWRIAVRHGKQVLAEFRFVVE
jgi:hypothetical protein